MKLVIDIPESVIEHLKDGSFGARIKDRVTLVDAVMNGTPFPNNATNGDVIQTVFSNALYQEGILTVDGQEYVCMHNGIDSVCDFDKSWWESPYKAGDTDGNSNN